MYVNANEDTLYSLDIALLHGNKKGFCMANIEHTLGHGTLVMLGIYVCN